MPEGEKDRLNRKLIELLNELRVALPGVQVLFGFLLILPFSQGFRDVTDLQRDVFFWSFLTAAGASVFLIAPSAYHRIRWRVPERETIEEKRRMLVIAGRFASAGLVLLGLAMGGAVFLVSDVLFGATAAGAAGGAVAVAAGLLWYAIPLRRRFRERAPSAPAPPGPGRRLS